ncbi:MAG: hypothetical protein U0559_10385 [Anaerolineae bacterium]
MERTKVIAGARSAFAVLLGLTIFMLLCYGLIFISPNADLQSIQAV